MYEKKIKLPNINDVYDFHSKICKLNCDVDLLAANSKYCVDAKSIMGILSMDLTQPVIVRTYSQEPDILAALSEAVEGRLIE